MEKKIFLYVLGNSYEKDTEILGINNADFSKLLDDLVEFRDDMDNACTLVGSFGIMYNLLSATEINYRTDDAFFNGNVLYVPEKEIFAQICENNGNSVFEIWLSVLREISDDIDTLENRYRERGAGKFLRSLLVYFTQFPVITELRKNN